MSMMSNPNYNPSRYPAYNQNTNYNWGSQYNSYYTQPQPTYYQPNYSYSTPSYYQPPVYQPPVYQPPTYQSKTLNISRELDGFKNGGIVGAMLNAGTANLASSKSAFTDSKYLVSSLFDTNAALALETATVSSLDKSYVQCADDLFVAGDPLVGGKGNNYASLDVSPKVGISTMFKDGATTGRGIVVNGQADTINAEGKIAFTQYGTVLKDDTGAQTKVQIAGGVTTITKPDGTTQTLLPGQSYTVGNPNDPSAKLYFAELPGQGEPRLVMEYYEKPTAESIAKLVSDGVSPEDAAAFRKKTTASFGFRIPDGGNTTRSPQGTGNSTPLLSSNGVKTYYDAHWNEADCSVYEVKKPVYPPPVYTPPVYTPPVYQQPVYYYPPPIYIKSPAPIYQPSYSGGYSNYDNSSYGNYGNYGNYGSSYGNSGYGSSDISSLLQYLTQMLGSYN